MAFKVGDEVVCVNLLEDSPMVHVGMTGSVEEVGDRLEEFGQTYHVFTGELGTRVFFEDELRLRDPKDVTISQLEREVESLRNTNLQADEYFRLWLEAVNEKQELKVRLDAALIRIEEQGRIVRKFERAAFDVKGELDELKAALRTLAD